MKRLFLILNAIFILTTFCSCSSEKQTTKGNASTTGTDIPVLLKGNFTDDYGIHYVISDSVWIQMPATKYHILYIDTSARFLIVQNDKNNLSEGGLFTRIDYTEFTGMEPFQWGFCLTVYDAKTFTSAKQAQSADKENARKGCNGFPFSRMKRE